MVFGLSDTKISFQPPPSPPTPRSRFHVSHQLPKSNILLHELAPPLFVSADRFILLFMKAPFLLHSHNEQTGPSDIQTQRLATPQQTPTTSTLPRSSHARSIPLLQVQTNQRVCTKASFHSRLPTIRTMSIHCGNTHTHTHRDHFHTFQSSSFPKKNFPANN